MSANSKYIDDLVKKIRRQKFIEEQEEEELAKKAAKQQNMEEWLNNADCLLNRAVKSFFGILGYSM